MTYLRKTVTGFEQNHKRREKFAMNGRYICFFSIMLFFVFRLPAAASDSGFTSWTEDLAYILAMNNLEYGESWLFQPYSGYQCERTENSDSICKQHGYEASHFTCEINLKHDGQIVCELSAKCVTEEKVNSAEYFDELTDTVDEAQDNFIPLYGLKVSEEDWDLIVEQLYKWNRKMGKFSYWLIDENVIFAAQKSEKDKTEISITIIPAGYISIDKGE